MNRRTAVAGINNANDEKAGFEIDKLGCKEAANAATSGPSENESRSSSGKPRIWKILQYS